MTIILSDLNRFFKIFSPLESPLNFQQSRYNITEDMLLQYLEKLKCSNILHLLCLIEMYTFQPIVTQIRDYSLYDSNLY